MTDEEEEVTEGDSHKQKFLGTSDIVAIILAAAIGLALNVVTIALLWAAAWRLGVDVNSGISENGTQLLTGWGGGIIGVLGSYIGFTFGKRRGQQWEDQ